MKALRLTPPRMRALERLRAAGRRGLPLIDLAEPMLMESYGLVELFTDPDRILSDRARITAHGRSCARTLIDSHRETA